MVSQLHQAEIGYTNLVANFHVRQLSWSGTRRSDVFVNLNARTKSENSARTQPCSVVQHMLMAQIDLWSDYGIKKQNPANRGPVGVEELPCSSSTGCACTCLQTPQPLISKLRYSRIKSFYYTQGVRALSRISYRRSQTPPHRLTHQTLPCKSILVVRARLLPSKSNRDFRPNSMHRVLL